jgi:hypothetical protein
VSSGSFQPFCSIGSTPDFSYIGQTFTYTQAPSLEILAMDANTPPQITENYTETGFLKLKPTNSYIERAFPTTDTSNMGNNGLLLALGISEQDPSFTSAISGKITYTFNSNDIFTYIRAPESRVAPFDSDIKIEIIKVEDDDGVTSIPATFEILPSAIELKYGRWVIDSAFGPETQNLTIPMRTEFWNGSSFVTNTSDHCSTYDASNITLSPSLSDGSTSANGSGMLISGKVPIGSQISLSAPGINNTGTVGIEFFVDSWLQYDWDNDPLTADTNPSSIASFGQHRGHDRIIYWQELSN